MHRLFLLFLFFCPAVSPGQTGGFPAVLDVFPESGSVSQPRPVVFNADYIWLDNRVFHLPTRRFLPRDSTTSWLPAHVQATNKWSDPRWPKYLYWEADPYDRRYYWATDNRNDSLILWRYDLKTRRQNRWQFATNAPELVFGRAGIWVSDHYHLWLIDRQDGRVLVRAGQAVPGYIMSLQPWGDDVLVTGRWIYDRKAGRYQDFFSLPAELKECRKPEHIQAFPEICLSWMHDENYREIGYLNTPGRPAIRLPFRLGDCGPNFLLGENLPLAWFCANDRIVSVDVQTGDSTVYTGKTGTPVGYLLQNGRFLAFRSEPGLQFFDKETCTFRVLPLPYGYEGPFSFYDDQRLIYLQFGDRWTILNFSKLDKTFTRTAVQDAYEQFKTDLQSFSKTAPSDFYALYASYLRFSEPYKKLDNPKIRDHWYEVTGLLRDRLYHAPDSVLERVDLDFQSGRFDPDISCIFVETLFYFREKQNDIYKGLELANRQEYETCFEDMNYGLYVAGKMRETAQRLDSIVRLDLTEDARLYAKGRVWMDYGLTKLIDGFSSNPFGCLERAFEYYRQLLMQYPASEWADNAAYDTLHFVDYHGSSTDDFTPEGNDNEAYRIFQRFLKDYPNSDKRPYVLLRMAAAVSRGVYDKAMVNVDKSVATEYLETISREYPDFAKKNEQFRRTLEFHNRERWVTTWSLRLSFDRETYRMADTIRYRVRISNVTGVPQTLSETFVRQWHTGLVLSLSEVRPAGCMVLSGDFPVVPDVAPVVSGDVVVPPGGYFESAFILGRRSQNLNYTQAVFDLTPGKQYRCHLEFRGDQWSHYWVSAQKDAVITVE